MTNHLFDCVHIDCAYLGSTQPISFAPVEKGDRKYFTRKRKTWKHTAHRQLQLSLSYVGLHLGHTVLR